MALLFLPISTVIFDINNQAEMKSRSERRGLDAFPVTGNALEITLPRDPATSYLDSRFLIHYKLRSVQSVPDQPISLDFT
jgi:hypothetical protein